MESNVFTTNVMYMVIIYQEQHMSVVSLLNMPLSISCRDDTHQKKMQFHAGDTSKTEKLGYIVLKKKSRKCT